ncbi:MAG: hypothetical protein MRQ09_05735 [Candidatus Midichloria sp.]|nr:hypothetical protein [Candidatus Midichloria sp.]
MLNIAPFPITTTTLPTTFTTTIITQSTTESTTYTTTSTTLSTTSTTSTTSTLTTTTTTNLCTPLSQLKQIVFGGLELKGNIYVNIQEHYGIHYLDNNLATAFFANQTLVENQQLTI